jgi:hypothetical protein
MTIDRTTEYLLSLINALCKLPPETKWANFRLSNDDPEQIGEYLSTTDVPPMWMKSQISVM